MVYPKTQSIASEFFLDDLTNVKIHFGDPHLAIALYVLEPICEHCRYPDEGFDLLGVAPSEKEAFVLFPPSISDLMRRYDRAEHRLYLRPVSPSAFPNYEIACTQCAVPFSPFESPWGISVEEGLYSSAVRGKSRHRTVSLDRSMSYGLFCPGTI